MNVVYKIIYHIAYAVATAWFDAVRDQTKYIEGDYDDKDRARRDDFMSRLRLRKNESRGSARSSPTSPDSSRPEDTNMGSSER